MTQVNPAEAKIVIGTNIIQTSKGSATDWDLEHIDGDEFMEVSVNVTDYADADGGFVEKVRYLPRFVEMHISSKRRTAEQIDATWLQLRSYLDSKQPALVTIFRRGLELSGTGYLTEVRKRDGLKWFSPPFLILRFVFPIPWWNGPTITQNFMSTDPMINFPLTMMEGEGLTTGVAAVGNVYSFVLGGDSESGFVLELTAQDNVLNPQVTNQDGKYIRAITAMSAGDVLRISTVKGDLGVTLNGAWCSRDRRSKFFQLPLGANTLTVTADSGETQLLKNLTYSQKYR